MTLAQKTVVLVLLSSGCRQQNLQLMPVHPDRIRRKSNYLEFALSGPVKNFTSSSGRPNLQRMYFPKYAPDTSICPFTTLCYYLDAARVFAPTDETAVFIHTCSPFQKASMSTLSRWAKTLLIKAGVLIPGFRVHSTRSVHSSKLYLLGETLDALLGHIGYQNASTFYSAYCVPIQEANRHPFKTALVTPQFFTAGDPINIPPEPEEFNPPQPPGELPKNKRTMETLNNRVCEVSKDIPPVDIYNSPPRKVSKIGPNTRPCIKIKQVIPDPRSNEQLASPEARIPTIMVIPARPQDPKIYVKKESQPNPFQQTELAEIETVLQDHAYNSGPHVETIETSLDVQNLSNNEENLPQLNNSLHSVVDQHTPEDSTLVTVEIPDDETTQTFDISRKLLEPQHIPNIPAMSGGSVTYSRESQETFTQHKQGTTELIYTVKSCRLRSWEPDFVDNTIKELCKDATQNSDISSTVHEIKHFDLRDQYLLIEANNHGFNSINVLEQVTAPCCTTRQGDFTLHPHVPPEWKDYDGPPIMFEQTPAMDKIVTKVLARTTTQQPDAGKLKSSEAGNIAHPCELQIISLAAHEKIPITQKVCVWAQTYYYPSVNRYLLYQKLCLDYVLEPTYKTFLNMTLLTEEEQCNSNHAYLVHSLASGNWYHN